MLWDESRAKSGSDWSNGADSVKSPIRGPMGAKGLDQHCSPILYPIYAEHIGPQAQVRGLQQDSNWRELLVRQVQIALEEPAWCALKEAAPQAAKTGPERSGQQLGC